MKGFAGWVLVIAACGFRATTPGTELDAATDGAVSDPALAYSFDEMTGAPTVADSSGNANTGSLFGAPVFAPGRHGNSMVFAGDDHILVANSASIDIGGTALTISGWVQLGNSPDNADDVIVAKPYAPIGTFVEPFYQFGVEYDDNQSDGIDFFFADEGGTRHGPFRMTGPGFNLWLHFAWTYDGNEVRGYIDGVLKLTAADSAAISMRGTPLIIGADGALAQLFGGRIDDLRIYRRALSEAEIQRDMTTPVP